MDALSAILNQLSQNPTSDGWLTFANLVDDMTDEALQNHADTIEQLLRSWPDHLRLSLVHWQENKDALRIGFCRVMPAWPSIYLPSLGVRAMAARKGSIFQPDYTGEGLGSAGLGANPDLSGFVTRISATCPGYDSAEVLVLVNFSPRFKSFGRLDWMALMWIDRMNGQVSSTFAFWTQKPSQRNQCLLLKPLAVNYVVLVTAQADDERVGAADLYVLWKYEPIYEYHWEGRPIRLPEIPQRNRASIFHLSEDERFVWGYHFTGHVVRLDIQALELKESKIQMDDINDIVPYADGLVLSTERDGFLFLDASFHVSKLEERHMAQGSGEVVAKVSGLSTGASVAEILAGTAPIQHRLEWFNWEMAAQTLQVKSSLTVEYRRKDWFAPHFQFKGKRVAGHRFCAWTNPADQGVLHVHDLVTGKSATMEWRPDPSELDGFDFDADGKHLIFWEHGSLGRWRFEAR